ncbi:MAG: response regulator [Spirochaetales bacterium]|nr:response regulator [Spirochaetales bacterium]
MKAFVNNEFEKLNNRILIVDDNPEIHLDFKKILMSKERSDREMEDLEEILFDVKPENRNEKGETGLFSYEIESAYSGEESIAKVREALEHHQPYALIFMDVRMPPGLNGVKATKKIWELNDDVEVVICTAYSDYSWDDIIEELGSSDHLLFLKKPFNSIEIKQMALSLVKKWNLNFQLNRVINNLETQVQKRTEELEIANESLKKANEQKTRFFINLAHETRTPLTLISNYLEKYISKAGMDSDLRILKHNIDLMLKNMVNFLDVEKLRRGQIFFNHNQAAPLSEILKSRIILFTGIAHTKNIIINHTIEDDLYVKADPYAVHRIINNIIENSIKYSGKGGVINITLGKSENVILFRVADNGIGMTKDQMNHIFLPYYQLSHKKRNLQGIGMGLYIVKRIADALHATIDIDSAINRGTTFIISFPDYVPEEKKDYEFDNDLSTPYDSGQTNIELKEENITPAKKNILLVDDNPEMLYFIQTFLKERYNVYMAENVKGALEKLKTISPPDIIISDIMMDELDGHQFFSFLKRSEEHNDIPFIFLTAKSSEEEKLKGLSEGAVDYIYKPFSIGELSAKIESIIDNRAQLKKKYVERIETRIKGVLSHIRKQNLLKERFLPVDKLGETYNLSKREREVILFLLDGCINKEIGDRLEISLRTVEFHLSNIYKKLNVRNKIELVNLLKP